MSLAREPEVVVARLRPHVRATFWPAVVATVDAGVTSYFSVSLAVDWQRDAVLAAGAALLVFAVLVPLFNWLGTNYTITSRRLAIRSGLLTRTRQELLHSRGYDVTLRQGVLQWAFRSGDILVNTGLDHPIVLKDLPSARLVATALQDLIEANVPPAGSRRQRDQWGGSDEVEAP